MEAETELKSVDFYDDVRSVRYLLYVFFSQIGPLWNLFLYDVFLLDLFDSNNRIENRSRMVDVVGCMVSYIYIYIIYGNIIWYMVDGIMLV